MKISLRRYWLAFFASSLVACVSTSEPIHTSQSAIPSATETRGQPQPVEVLMASNPNEAADSASVITLEQIMADPQWLGRQPERAFWADDGESVLYFRQRENSQLDDLYRRQLSDSGNGELVPIEQLHEYSYRHRVLNTSATKAVWVFDNSLFVKDLATGQIRQLTRGTLEVSQPMFLQDDSVAFRSGNHFVRIDPVSGISEVLVSWQFANQPTALHSPQDYIAQQQQAVLEVVQKRRAEAKERFEYQQMLRATNSAMTPTPFYFGTGMTLQQASLSPNGRYVILAIKKSEAAANPNDIMPSYVNEDGRVKTVPVRQRVADHPPENHELWFVDIQTGQKREIAYNNLPGFNEDVLAAVKQENAAAIGQTYQPNRLPRNITLMNDWYWSGSAIQWHQNGNVAAIMLEAWDNKDRWLTTFRAGNRALEVQERLHDEAWISYRFNSFGWLNKSETLYYLSEKSGYAHVYLQKIGESAQALTSGQYEVDELTLTQDDQYLYFTANRTHPGIYEVYRVALADGEIEQLTQLSGKTSYLLSPDESALLLIHSTPIQPPELYVAQLSSIADMERITHTVSDAFNALPWANPSLVAIPSSHTDLPIYARLYTPDNVQQGEPRKAVVFTHGAGYLQNAHMGWSSYFREFMFHSMLVQQGYVVLDIDYRASRGYGRDWRTAIYRQMGTPEVEDLRDSVNWLAANANVDIDRVGTYGGSYGGFLTFMAMFKAPDLFQAGAALRPVTDWAHYNHPYTSNILNTPDVDPIAYQRSSPIYYADGLQKPLLINAPMVDNNVFFVDVVRLVQRLIELEKPHFETAIFPVETHGFVEPSSWLDEYRRIYRLFEQNL